MGGSHREILATMREAVLDGRYVVTPHAWRAMRDDRLTLPDVESAILRGRIDRVYHDDPRGPRYRVVGTAADLMTDIGVVVRLVLTDRVLVVTVFVLETGDE